MSTYSDWAVVLKVQDLRQKNGIIETGTADTLFPVVTSHNFRFIVTSIP